MEKYIFAFVCMRKSKFECPESFGFFVNSGEDGERWLSLPNMGFSSFLTVAVYLSRECNVQI